MIKARHLHILKVFMGLMLALACMAAVPSWAKGDPLPLGDDPLQYTSAKDYLYFYRDPLRERTAEEVAITVLEFEPIASTYIDFGLTDDRIWLKFSAKNTSNKAGTFRLDVKRQYVTELALYEMPAAGPPALLLSHKQEDPFAQREIASRFLLKDIRFQAGETKSFLIGYRSSTTTFLPLAMGTVDGVAEHHGSELRVDYFLNGMLAAMILYSLLMLPVIGWRLALSFAAYIGAGAFYVLVADGYPMEKLWPNAAWVNEPMNLASMLAMTALGLNFCRELFGFDEFARRFDRLLLVLLFIAALCVFLTFPLIEQEGFTVPAYLLPPIANICVCAAGIIAYRAGRIGALPFLIGALMVFASLVYATLAHVVPGQFDLDATLDFGHLALLGECLAFALAILVRFLSIRQQRDDALSAKLAEAEQKLQLSEQLMASQRDFEAAKSHAERGRQRLSEMSHDIRQPLLILKDAIARLGEHEGGGDKRLKQAVDYLQSVGLDQAREAQEIRANDRPSLETFPVRVLFDSISELYSAGAARKGITLKVRQSDFEIASNPVALMRVLSNLVDNAQAHGGGDTVLLAARKRAGGVRIEVWNNGRGMAGNALSKLKARGVKGAASDGSGLGLAIVQRICDELGHDFQLHSIESSGSAAFILIPNP